jgi:hypothetical protein
MVVVLFIYSMQFKNTDDAIKTKVRTKNKMSQQLIFMALILILYYLVIIYI